MSILQKNHPRMTATFGIPTGRTLGEQYEKNMLMMEAIARASGATFYGIVQPNAYIGAAGEPRHWEKKGKPRQYIIKLQALYKEIRNLPTRLPFVHSFISIFEADDGTYIDDGIHATLKGDRIIAARVLDLINADLLRKANGASQ